MEGKGEQPLHTLSECRHGGSLRRLAGLWCLSWHVCHLLQKWYGVESLYSLRLIHAALRVSWVVRIGQVFWR